MDSLNTFKSVNSLDYIFIIVDHLTLNILDYRHL